MSKPPFIVGPICCETCGQPLPETRAGHAIRSAGLTKDEDSKVAEFIKYLAAKKNKSKRAAVPASVMGEKQK